jgi:hypothetical protein
VRYVSDEVIGKTVGGINGSEEIVGGSIYGQACQCEP